MALEIKPTPVLKGRSADRFLELVKKNESNKTTPEKQEEMAKIVAAVMKKAKL